MFTKIKRWFNRPRNPAGNVYYVRLRTPHGIFYKLGFTSKSSLVERMSYGNNGDEKLIDRHFFFARRNDAWDVEQTLLEHFSKHRAFGKYSNDPTKPLCGRGQSELFMNDILGLDDDLYTQTDEKTLKELQIENDGAMGGCLMILIGLVLAPFTLGFSLFFILGGTIDFFGSTKSYMAGVKPARRPVHSQAIQELITALNSREKAP